MKRLRHHTVDRVAVPAIRPQQAASFHTVAARTCGKDPTVAARSSVRLFVLGVSTLLVTALGCARHQPNLTDLQPAASARQRAIDRMVASTVKVTVERDGRRVTSASGIVVASRPAGNATGPVSYVLTAAHVLSAAEGATIAVGFCGSHAANGKLTASVISRGKPEALDLALLRVSGIAVPPVRLPEDDLVHLGQPILVVGFPEGERLGLSSGIVSQLPLAADQNGIPADRLEHRIVIDAAAPRGVSGGGVFEAETGHLVGIVQGHQTVSIAMKDQTQTYTLKFPVPGATFVVPVMQIRSFLANADNAKDLHTLVPGPTSAVSRLPK